MSTTTATTLVFPAIDRSEVEAARRFLTAGADPARPARPAGKSNPPSCPTVRNGITRARHRSAARDAG